MRAGAEARFAVYFAPEPSSALARFGRRWLGRDAVTGMPEESPELPGFSAGQLARLTADARHYGFHATLKPPFALAAGSSVETLQHAIATFAARSRPIVAPPLRLAAIGGFLALVPAQPSTELNELAADCVRAFDDFRAPPDEAELARRRTAGLTAAQEALLLCWGYPYVMEEFRFHLTLTGRLDEAERAKLVPALEPIVAPLCRRPLRVDAIALFAQRTRDEPFRQIRRFSFAGRARIPA
jgi:putative phosphonate metabolism protein